MWSLTWTLLRSESEPVWFAFYVAMMTFGFFFAAALTILTLWRWTGPGGSLTRVIFRMVAGVLVSGLVYGFVAAPLAWALFDRCLFPTVEHQGECRYKPD